MANKTDLVTYVAQNVEGMTKKDAVKVVDAVLEGIEAGLKADGKVQIIGFGSLEVRERAARKGRNPQTGEEIEIPASRTVGFSAGKGLKEAVK
jgi:DNA-binding protein HU-beta